MRANSANKLATINFPRLVKMHADRKLRNACETKIVRSASTELDAGAIYNLVFRAASTIHLSHTAETGERVEGEEGGGETERTASPAISAIPHRKISQNYWYRPNRPMTTLVFPDLAVGAASQSMAFLVDVEAH